MVQPRYLGDHEQIEKVAELFASPNPAVRLKEWMERYGGYQRIPLIMAAERRDGNMLRTALKSCNSSAAAEEALQIALEQRSLRLYSEKIIDPLLDAVEAPPAARFLKKAGLGKRASDICANLVTGLRELRENRNAFLKENLDNATRTPLLIEVGGFVAATSGGIASLFIGGASTGVRTALACIAVATVAAAVSYAAEATRHIEREGRIQRYVQNRMP